MKNIDDSLSENGAEPLSSITAMIVGQQIFWNQKVTRKRQMAFALLQFIGWGTQAFQKM